MIQAFDRATDLRQPIGIPLSFFGLSSHVGLGLVETYDCLGGVVH